VVAVALVATALSFGLIPAGAAGRLGFSKPIKLAGAGGDTEPRDAVTPDGAHFTVTDSGAVYRSTDGVHAWTHVGDLSNQFAGSIDTDLVATRTGRLIGVELDFGGINFRTSYSDDGGRTWTGVAGPGGLPMPFTGTGYADQDRPWLAVGPDDPATHQPRVYMLMHNLLSGAATHNMWVATSTDNGASFGPFIPVTLPGSQAWLDLQCADSGGPSDLFVDQASGRVFAVWGARSSAVGGCGASVTGSFEINVVAATRVWIATAPADGTADPTQWTQSLAVDDNATGQIVGMQLAPGAVDSAGNVYIVYPESLHAYPDYTGAAIKYVHTTEAQLVANPYGSSGPAQQIWSAPVTVSPSGQPGNLLPHLVAGGPGQVDFAWFHGRTVGGKVNWYPTAAQTLDALSAHPAITTVALSDFPAYSDQDASIMMGACASPGPLQGVQNGFACGRSTDVWGVALDRAGRFLVTWPGDGPTAGTYVSMQTSGPTFAEVTSVKAATAVRTPFTAAAATPRAAQLLAAALIALGTLLLGAGLRSRRWVSTARRGSTPSR
jgi:hypothetical protein